MMDLKRQEQKEKGKNDAGERGDVNDTSDARASLCEAGSPLRFGEPHRVPFKDLLVLDTIEGRNRQGAA
jgi:hypothetical protein